MPETKDYYYWVDELHNVAQTHEEMWNHLEKHGVDSMGRLRSDHLLIRPDYSPVSDPEDIRGTLISMYADIKLMEQARADMIANADELSDGDPQWLQSLRYRRDDPTDDLDPLYKEVASKVEQVDNWGAWDEELANISQWHSDLDSKFKNAGVPDDMEDAGVDPMGNMGGYSGFDPVADRITEMPVKDAKVRKPPMAKKASADMAELKAGLPDGVSIADSGYTGRYQ